MTIIKIIGNPDTRWWSERDGMVFRETTIQFDSNMLRTGLAVIANHFGGFAA